MQVYNNHVTQKLDNKEHTAGLKLTFHLAFIRTQLLLGIGGIWLLALAIAIIGYRAKVVILDVTGVPIMDSGVVNHLNKTIQAARLKGAQTIITGISDAVAESIVDLGIDWSHVVTLGNLRAGLKAALDSMGFKVIQG